jgi:hypothetical protein
MLANFTLIGNKMKQRSLMQVNLASAMLLMGAIGAYADHGGSGNGGPGNGGPGNGGSGNNNVEIRLRTKLSGAAIQGRTPSGSADFRSDSQGRTRLNVEVEDVNLPSGTVLTVAIQHGATVTTAGTITLATSAENELELNSQNGDTVPAVLAGDMVTVSNAGVTILAGVF